MLMVNGNGKFKKPIQKKTSNSTIMNYKINYCIVIKIMLFKK